MSLVDIKAHLRMVKIAVLDLNLSAVTQKNSVFWDITPCSPLKVNRRFGGTCHLHLQCQRISQANKQREAGSKQILVFLTTAVRT
jgi:hypothetical protein